MAKFLTTSGTSYYIEQIITSARKELFLLTPYLKLSKTFIERLRDADSRNVPITLIFGKSELNEREKEKLWKLQNLRIFFFENLHAKCYFNEDMMVITSMNLYEFSEKNNREMGVLLKKSEDMDIYQKGREEAQSIMISSIEKERPGITDEIVHYVSDKIDDTRAMIDSVENIRKTGVRKSMKSYLKGWMGSNSQPIEKNVRSGFCIRCGVGLKWDRSNPLCSGCAKIWSEYANPEYIETFCHSCGTQARTSVSKPECRGCFRKRK